MCFLGGWVSGFFLLDGELVDTSLQSGQPLEQGCDLSCLCCDLRGLGSDGLEHLHLDTPLNSCDCVSVHVVDA